MQGFYIMPLMRMSLKYFSLGKGFFHPRLENGWKKPE